MMGFGTRLAAAMAERGPLCVGIDPHPALLRAWQLPVNPDGLEQFCLSVVDAIGTQAAVFKPQSAFFEVFGSAGIAVLERVLDAGRAAGALMLLDGKRGDIGSTMDGYAAAYLADDAPLVCDALTVSAYLGFGSLQPVVDVARDTGRGLFVLAATSNPEGPQVQHARRADGVTVAQYMIDSCAAVNAECSDGFVGVVVGATADTAGLSLADFNGPILAPGIGAQGATVEDLHRVFGPALPRVLASSSREILGAGPTAVGLQDAVRRQVDVLRGMLG